MNTPTLPSLYRDLADRWRRSALHWREVADKAARASDWAHASFAHFRAQQCESWAIEDAQKAEAVA